jgi:lauroyl/myristoyl acyltransferase
MDSLLYGLARMVIALLQAMPLLWVARIGRCGGAVVYWLDGRHRRMTLRNLTMCFGPEKSAEEIHALAKENFRRIGENFASAAKTASMSADDLRPHFEFKGVKGILPAPGSPPQSRVGAIGHFGNFELYARLTMFAPMFQSATTYRGLREPGLNRLLQSLRERSGCLFFERRTEGEALKTAMRKQGLLLGLLSDQHAGKRGVRIPFLGHECSTTPAPAIFALRYNYPLHTCICYRVALGRWQLELGEEIPTRENGLARSVEAIMRDVNHAFEAAVRRDPANWFWVHNRWKPAIVEQKLPPATPEAAMVEDGP